jgi:hypothetical protein
LSVYRQATLAVATAETTRPGYGMYIATYTR